MKHYGLVIPEGSSIANLTAPQGTAFPALPNKGEIFFLTTTNNLYTYTGTTWDRILSASEGSPIVGPSNGEMIQWNGTNWVYIPTPGANSLDDLSDVDLTGSPLPAVDNVLTYNGTSWVQAAQSGAILTTVTVDTFTGTGSPSNVEFTLTSAPSSENELLVYVGGVYQEQSTYSVSGTTLTLTEAPADSVGIEVVSLPTSISGNTITNSSEIIGSPPVSVFNVNYTANNIFVYRNGIKLISGTEYTATNETTVTLTPAPSAGDVIAFEVFAPFLSAYTDHTLLTNIGNNTHAQIDTHIATGSPLHYPMTAISITESQISDLGTYEPANANIQTHIATGSPIHFLQSEISITESQISDLGTYEPAFAKNTAFNKDFGTGSPQVARGDHLHTGVYEPANANIQSHISDGTLHFTKESIALEDLTNVASQGSPAIIDGMVLTYNGTRWQQETPASGVTDHTLLSNIGTNTHAQIDTHIATGSPIHFLQSEISITESQISDFGSYEPANANIQQHISTGSPIHFLQSEISITESQISDFGTYEPAFAKNTAFNKDFGTGSPQVARGNHLHTGVYEPANANIQSHIGDSTIHFTKDSIALEDLSDVASQGSPTIIPGMVLTYTGSKWQQQTPAAGVTDHTLLSNIGTNTHAQIDTHIATGSPLHYPMTAISITESQISDLGSYEPANANIQTHIATGSPIHFTQAQISITESQISDLQTYLLNVVEDLTPQLGGNLDVNNFDIVGTDNAAGGSPVTLADINLTAGQNLVGTPGAINITGGDGNTGYNYAGAVNITGGEGIDAGYGGIVTIAGGNGQGGGSPPTVYGAGGIVNILGGNALTKGAGGQVNIIAGAPGPLGTIDGADVVVTASDGTTYGYGGDIIISSGSGGYGDQTGGQARLLGGYGTGTGEGGPVKIRAGASGTGGTGGEAYVAGGTCTAVNGTGGAVDIHGGDGGLQGGAALVSGGRGTRSGANGGNVVIQPGAAAAASATTGKIILQAASVTNAAGIQNAVVELLPATNATSPFRVPVQLRFLEHGSNGINYVGLVAPDSVVGTVGSPVEGPVWTLPQDNPATAAGQFLTTNASGVLSFAAVAGAGSPIVTSLNDLTDVVLTGSPLPAADDVLRYNGTSWVQGPAGGSITNSSETATGGQTTFNVTYSPGNIFVYLNGAKLIDSTDYTANNGTTVVLTSGAAVDDIVAFEVFGSTPLLVATDHTTLTSIGTNTHAQIDAFITAVGSPPFKNIVEDTTPQLGGNLDVNEFIITSGATGNYDGDISIVGASKSGGFGKQGGSISLTAGDSGPYGNAGGITLKAGQDSSNGTCGAVYIKGGYGTGANSQSSGGDVNLQGGRVYESGYTAGDVKIYGGNAAALGNPGNVVIKSGIVNGSNPSDAGDITIVASNGAGSPSAGGAITIASGNGGDFAAGGAIAIIAGRGGTAAGAGGDVTLTAGISDAAGAASGSINLNAAAGSGVAWGGNINLTAGEGGTGGTSIGGSVTILSGKGGYAGDSGNILLQSADSANTGIGGYAGNINLVGGAGGDYIGCFGGTINLTGGVAGAATASNAGKVVLTGGAGVNNFTGGAVQLTGGVGGSGSPTSGAGGGITITSGAGGTHGNAANVNIIGGDGGSVSGNGGDINITPGGVTSGTDGETVLNVTTKINGILYFVEFDDGNSGAADTIDFSVANKHKSTLTANCTYTFTAPPGPTNTVLRIVTTGSFTATWPATVKWAGGTAPTITLGAGSPPTATDIIAFYFDGTNYHGSYSQDSK